MPLTYRFRSAPALAENRGMSHALELPILIGLMTDCTKLSNVKFYGLTLSPAFWAWECWCSRGIRYKRPSLSRYEPV